MAPTGPPGWISVPRWPEQERRGHAFLFPPPPIPRRAPSPAPRVPSGVHHTTGLQSPLRQRPRDAGSGGASAPLRRRQTGRGVCSGADRGRQRREEAQLSEHRDARALRALRAAGASLASAHRSCALLGGCRALQAHGASRGIQTPEAQPVQAGLAEAEEPPSRRGGRLLSSRVQDEACLVWASCDEAGRLAPPGPSRILGHESLESPTPHPPPPLHDLLQASSLAARLLWQPGGTARVQTAALKRAPPIRQRVRTRGAAARSVAGAGC